MTWHGTKLMILHTREFVSPKHEDYERCKIPLPQFWKLIITIKFQTIGKFIETQLLFRLQLLSDDDESLLLLKSFVIMISLNEHIDSSMTSWLQLSILEESGVSSPDQLSWSVLSLLEASVQSILSLGSILHRKNCLQPLLGNLFAGDAGSIFPCPSSFSFGRFLLFKGRLSFLHPAFRIDVFFFVVISGVVSSCTFDKQLKCDWEALKISKPLRLPFEYWLVHPSLVGGGDSMIGASVAVVISIVEVVGLPPE